MRLALCTLLVAGLSGCILEPGLSQSTTACPDSTLLDAGFKFVVADPGRLVGRCVEIRPQGEVDGVLRRLGADGVAHLPIEGPGHYLLKVSVRDADDKYCRLEAFASGDHPGQGLVELQANVGRVCS